jgi:uncharacterized protein YciI
MNQYLYRIQPTRMEMLSEGPTPRESELVSQHFQYLQGLMAQGNPILAGRTQTTDDPDGMGIIVLKAESDEVAQTIVDSDPAVANGVFRAKLFPYRVALIAQENL